MTLDFSELRKQERRSRACDALGGHRLGKRATGSYRLPDGSRRPFYRCLDCGIDSDAMYARGLA